MQNDGRIYSRRIERNVLGGLINNPKIFPDIERFIGERDFYTDIHETIFCIIKSIVENNQQLDKVLLCEKVENLGIKFEDRNGDKINVYKYVKDIAGTQTQPKAAIESSRELLKYRVRREILNCFENGIDYIRKCGSDSLDEIIANCDKMYTERMTQYNIEDEPVKLFEGIEELVEERGNNPREDNGLITPYKEFNEAYGGLRPGNVYAICSRPGQGKTTWINDICFKTAKMNNIKALILDTEMETKDIQFRMASSVTGVSVWHLETGKWRQNPDLFSKVRASLPSVEGDNAGVYHSPVGNKTIDQICSDVRRWYLTEVGRGNQCIIAYDYVKLTGERIGQNWAEHQAIGEKIDKLKKLSEEINAAMITAMQLNRSGEGRTIVDDSSAISLSDRLQWYASFVAIFRRKTLDEMAEDNEFDANGNLIHDRGTHKLIPTKTRFQGRQAAGHQDLVRRTLDDGRVTYENNCLYFSVRNFNVEERGSLRGLVSEEQEQFSVEGQESNDGEIDL